MIAIPEVYNASIEGDFVEGQQLWAVYKYRGGIEQATSCKWISKSKGEVIYEGISFIPKKEHIGQHLCIELVPTSTRDVVGTKNTVEGAVIKPGM